jgi:hypothetical protein
MKHQPTRFQIEAFKRAMLEAQSQPEFTDEHLQFLARRRDQFLAQLANR